MIQSGRNWRVSRPAGMGFSIEIPAPAIAGILFSLVMGFGGGRGYAQTLVYNDNHDFEIDFRVLPISATWRHFEHTYAYWEGFPEHAAVNPGQLPAWRNWVIEEMTANGLDVIQRSGNSRVPVTMETVNVPVGAFNQEASVTSTAGFGSSTARSNLSLQAPVSSPLGTRISGAIGANGTVDFPDNSHKGGLAYSASILTFALNGTGGLPSVIRWEPDILIIGPPPSGTWEEGGRQLFVRDPIFFEIRDEGGSLIERQSAVDIWLEGLQSKEEGQPVQFSWQNGQLSGSNIGEAEFHIEVLGSRVLPAARGTAVMRISGGSVTNVEETGIFVGQLPAVGTSGTFSSPFLDALDLAIDETPLPNGYVAYLDVSSSLGRAAPIPDAGPTSLLLLLAFAALTGVHGARWVAVRR